MKPVMVTAIVPGQIALPGGPLALDALLAWAVATRDGLPPAMTAAESLPIEIPVELEPRERFHLCSFSRGVFETRELKWINKRFPIKEAQSVGGPKVRRIQTSAGKCKSYRLPMEVGYLVESKLSWYAIADAGAVRELLEIVTHLGKKRSTGNGHVEKWRVEECEAWNGFPVVRDGYPLRPLPVDWPGLREDVEHEYRVLTYPYWNHRDEQLCAVHDTRM